METTTKPDGTKIQTETKKDDGLYANLYFYNPKSGELEFQSAGLISGGKASWI